MNGTAAGGGGEACNGGDCFLGGTKPPSLRMVYTSSVRSTLGMLSLAASCCVMVDLPAREGCVWCVSIASLRVGAQHVEACCAWQPAAVRW